MDSEKALKHWIANQENFTHWYYVPDNSKLAFSESFENWRVWLIVWALGASFLLDLQVFSHKSCFCKRMIHERFFIQLVCSVCVACFRSINPVVFIICGPNWVGRLSTSCWTDAGGPNRGFGWMVNPLKSYKIYSRSWCPVVSESVLLTTGKNRTSRSWFLLG